MNESRTCERIKVVVRCRPLSKDEESVGYSSIVKIISNNEVEVIDPNRGAMKYVKQFKFDVALGHDCEQHQVYEKTVRPLVNSVLCGFNSTIFAYGQSGSGKTYTMEGNNKIENGVGVISRAMHHVFDGISKSCSTQYLVRVTYLEIYQDEIKDLLNKDVKHEKCEIRENKDSGIYVTNIKAFVCNNLKQIEAVVLAGNKRRTTGYTSLNEKSSRSHAVLTVTVEMKDMIGPLENIVRVGKLNLVDLAGSERQLKTNALGARLKEANKINLSLTALGNVISALTQNKISHIPYRDSKLTRLLRDSLGGNSKTLMIANIGPASINYEETLNTLRFASRVSMIKNKPKINQDPTDALLVMYQEEIIRLKAQLKSRHLRKMDQRTKLVTTNLNSVDVVDISDESLISVFDRSKDTCQEVNVSLKFDREFICNLTRRVELMESKLLSGPSGLLQHTNKLQLALNTRNCVIEESIQREKDMHEILELHRETTVEVQNEYSNLSIEVDIKRQKLIKSGHEHEIIRQEIINAHNKFNTDRRSVEHSCYELIKRIKLKILIVENFIPHQEHRKVMEKLHFISELETWKCMPGNEPESLSKLNSVFNCRRPITMYTAIASRKADYLFQHIQTLESERKTFRYKSENILRLNLVHSPKTTNHPTPPMTSPDIVENVISNALLQEDDLEIDVSHLKYPTSNSKNSLFTDVSLSCLVQGVKSCQTRKPSLVYPKARGLVPK